VGVEMQDVVSDELEQAGGLKRLGWRVKPVDTEPERRRGLKHDLLEVVLRERSPMKGVMSGGWR
jgi:hypothetical protein